MPRADRHGLPARPAHASDLARAVAHMAPEALRDLVVSRGLDDCAELLAMVTGEQLAGVLDLDLWRAPRPGAEERFDASRFGEWLDALADAGIELAARRIAELDPALVIAGLAAHVAVFDPIVFAPAVEPDGGDAVLNAADERGVHCEVGGYIVVAKGSESWDTIVALLVALDEDHRDSFHAVMRGCRRLSNSAPEADGFHDLLDDVEQAHFDLGVSRERRREAQGYVPPERARAFLQEARRTRPAYRAGGVREPASASGLAHAGEGGRGRLSRLAAAMRRAHEHGADVAETRSQELAFLANVLVAGCPLQGRPFTAREASAAAAAVCNLGLENWPVQPVPDDVLVTGDLTMVFQAGWAVLHHQVSMFAAERVMDVLRSLECHDREIQVGLHGLRRMLSAACEADAPWRARNALEILAMLDMPAWAALQGLIDEFPVVLANVRASGPAPPRSVSLSDFDFISGNGQVAAVHEFLRSLPDLLAG